MPIHIYDLQVPVDARSGYVTFIQIADANGAFIRCVATNSTAFSGLGLSPGVEYWYSLGSTSIEGCASLTVAFDTHESSEYEIRTYTDGFTQVFSVAQTLSNGWEMATYAVPSGAKARLFRVQDPDDRTKYVGLLVEQDSGNVLQDIVWYKTSDPANGWLYGGSPPSPTWALVEDENDDPSVDPADIDPVSTWYHASNEST